MSGEKLVVVKLSDLVELCRAELELNALNNAGVDNWEWISEVDFPDDDEADNLAETYVLENL